jgi:hypothetical protein
MVTLSLSFWLNLGFTTPHTGRCRPGQPINHGAVYLEETTIASLRRETKIQNTSTIITVVHSHAISTSDSKEAANT